jgi:hypothetical protein
MVVGSCCQTGIAEEDFWMMSHRASGDSPRLEPAAARNTAQARHHFAGAAGTAVLQVQSSLTAAAGRSSEVSTGAAGAVCEQTAAAPPAVQRLAQLPRLEAGQVAALLRRLAHCAAEGPSHVLSLVPWLAATHCQCCCSCCTLGCISSGTAWHRCQSSGGSENTKTHHQSV